MFDQKAKEGERTVAVGIMRETVEKLRVSDYLPLAVRVPGALFMAFRGFLVSVKDDPAVHPLPVSWPRRPIE